MSTIPVMLFSALLFVATGTFDSYVKDYEKIVETYKSKKNLSFSVVYKSFDTSTTKADTAVTGKFQFKGTQFHTKLAGAESIKNNQYYLSIDHVNKIMFLGKANTVSGNYLPVATIDTAFRRLKLDVTTQDKNEGRVRQYSVKYPDESDTYKSIDVEFDLTTYFLKKVVMHIHPPVNEYDLKDWKYIENPYVEMNYQNYSFEEISESAFSLSKFLDIKNGDDAELKPEYKKYELVNSISISNKIK